MKRLPLNPKPIRARTSTMLDLVNAHPKQVIRAFKVVNEHLRPHSHYRRSLTRILPSCVIDDHVEAYCVGGVFHELDASTDVREDCAKGLNVATYEWCMYVCTVVAKTIDPARDLLMEVEFKREDVAAFPGRLISGYYYTKFRVFRFKVVACRTFTPAEARRLNSRITPALINHHKRVELPAPPMRVRKKRTR